MPGFSSFKELADAHIDGKLRYSTWRKLPNLTTPAGGWFDLSLSPGNPMPQYYAATPSAAIALAQSSDGGLYHGGGVFPKTKHLRAITIMSSSATPLPLTAILLDYCLFYPFIEEGSTDEQPLINNVALTRYTSGEGLQIMAVSQAARTGGQSFIVKYTNSKGVSGRVSLPALQNATSVNGSLVTHNGNTTNNPGAFISLQPGDTGVRSIESVTMLGVDVGLFALVLVKPLAQLCLNSVTAPVEIDYFTSFSQAPIIADDAYLNFIISPRNTVAGTSFHGDITTVWK